MKSLIKNTLTVALVGAVTSSCFAVADLSRFKTDESADAGSDASKEISNFSDLKVTVRGFTSHVTEQFEYRVVDNSNVIQSRGFIVPLGGVQATFLVKGAVPKQNGPFHFDFYADHDASKGYDKRPDTQLDHSWRLPLEDRLLDSSGAYVIVFDHNTSFTNLNNPVPATEFGKPVTVHLRGLQPFQGKRFEVRIADASSKRVVAMYRIPVATATEYDVFVPGMIETGVSYTVEVYTDDGIATGSTINAFRLEIVANAIGIETSFNGANPAETPGMVKVTDALAPPPMP